MYKDIKDLIYGYLPYNIDINNNSVSVDTYIHINGELNVPKNINTLYLIRDYNTNYKIPDHITRLILDDRKLHIKDINYDCIPDNLDQVILANNASYECYNINTRVLKFVNVSFCTPTYRIFHKNIEEIHLDKSDIYDISHCNVKKIYIEFNSTIINVENNDYLENIYPNTLEDINCNITNLCGCKKIKTINSFVDINNIKDCENITNLYIKNHINAEYNISNLPNLEYVEINSLYGDVTLDNLASLKKIYVRSNSLKINNIPKIECADIYCNGVAPILLRNCKYLEELKVINSKNDIEIVNCGMLKILAVKCRKLTLHNTPNIDTMKIETRDTIYLHSLNKLRELNVSSRDISVSNCNNLRCINLPYAINVRLTNLKNLLRCHLTRDVNLYMENVYPFLTHYYF